MIKWRSPAVIITAVAAVVGSALFLFNERERRTAAAECQSDEASEDCKENGGRGSSGYFVGVPGLHGRGMPRAMTGQPDPLNAAVAGTGQTSSQNQAQSQDQAHSQGQTQRAGFGATGRSRGFSGG